MLPADDFATCAFLTCTISTTITIAHRLTTIRRSDVIHVIEDGRVEDEGTHGQLLEKKGRYAELCQAQM